MLHFGKLIKPPPPPPSKVLKINKPPGGLNREFTVDGSIKTGVASAILSSQKALYDHLMKNV